MVRANRRGCCDSRLQLSTATYYRSLMCFAEPGKRDRRTIAQDRVLYVVQETGESGEWRSAGSVGSLYPYRSAAENSDPPLTWKSAVRINVGPGARVAR